VGQRSRIKEAACCFIFAESVWLKMATSKLWTAQAAAKARSFHHTNDGMPFSLREELLGSPQRLIGSDKK
jgi:hypothetical protein